LTPYLSSLWLGLVTPLFARIGRNLIESIRHPTIVRDPSARLEFPIQPVGVQQAIADALRGEDQEPAQSRCSDQQSPRRRGALQWFALALFLIICLGAGALGAAWTNLSVRDWYVALQKPSWTPPNGLFGPVWTALYIAMAVAAVAVTHHRLLLRRGTGPCSLSGSRPRRGGS
jgi:hypothetical protein